jgi:hypothetical protein
MITINSSERGVNIPIDVLMAPLRDKVSVLDIIRSDGLIELFVDLKDRDYTFNKLVRKITNGFRVRRA